MEGLNPLDLLAIVAEQELNAIASGMPNGVPETATRVGLCG